MVSRGFPSGDRDAAVIADREARVVSHLPRVSIGIGEVPRVATPIGAFGRLHDPPASGNGSLEGVVRSLLAFDVDREGDTTELRGRLGADPGIPREGFAVE